MGRREKVGALSSVCATKWLTFSSRYPPLEPFEHYEHGKDADPSFPNLLKDAKVTDLTANIGAEITGVQLSKLTEAGKNELALFVAQRKVVGRCHHRLP